MTNEQIQILNKPIEDWDFSVRFLNWCKNRGITSLKDICDIGFTKIFDELHAWNAKCGYSTSDGLRDIFASIGIEVPEYSPKTAQVRKRLNEINAELGQLLDELEEEKEA